VSGDNQRLVAVGQASTPPNLTSARTSESGDPNSATLWQMHSGFDQPGFSGEQDFDDLLGGSAEIRLRATWRSARPGSGQRPIRQ
jgi:hypothetical protein